MTFVDLWFFRGRGRSRLASVLALLAALIAISGNSLAGQLKLAWDPVAGATGYRLYYGTSSGNYASNVDAQNQTSATLTGLTDGTRYYVAVKAYNGTTTSNYSNETNAVVPAAPPVASFSASPTTGTAPLVVTLTDTSSGSITSRSWNLGDGTTAATQVVAKTYSNPGTYSVTLTVNGSGGSTTATGSISVTAPTATGGTGGTSTGGGTADGTTGGTTGGSGTTGGTAAHQNGLVAAYGFEEQNGRGVVDSSGMRNRGTISGGDRVTTSFFGRALRFNGKGDWVTIDDSASLDLTKGMTLEAWVYPTVRMTNRATVVLKERSGGLAYSLHANSARGNPSSTINTEGANKELSAGAQLPVNTWTHLAATYDGSSQRLYVNGELAGTRPQAGSISTSRGKLRIGGNSISGDEYFTGYIDEVRVYNRALTQAEIALDSKYAVVGLLVSTSPDRSNAVPLNGLPVSGTIYVYYALIGPNAASNPVRQVAFWLDNPNPSYPSGTPTRIETLSPFDFAGTVESGSAAGFDTTGLSKGIHTITAQVTLSDGTIPPFIIGTFTIR